MNSVLSIIAGLATITGAIFGIFKWITWRTQVTQDQKNQNIDKQEEDNKNAAKESGRPV